MHSISVLFINDVGTGVLSGMDLLGSLLYIMSSKKCMLRAVSDNITQFTVQP